MEKRVAREDPDYWLQSTSWYPGIIVPSSGPHLTIACSEFSAQQSYKLPGIFSPRSLKFTIYGTHLARSIVPLPVITSDHVWLIILKLPSMR